MSVPNPLSLSLVAALRDLRAAELDRLLFRECFLVTLGALHERTMQLDRARHTMRQLQARARASQGTQAA